MKRPDASSQVEWMDARVEAYVDGDLPDDAEARFEQIMQDNEYWEKQVSQACRIRDSLRSFPEPTAPPELTQRIFEQTSRAHQSLPWWREMLQSVMQTWRAVVAARQQPVVDYAVGLALVAVAVFFIVMPLDNGVSPNGVSPQVSSQLDVPITAPYSEAEVKRAVVKAKWTFNHVSDVGEMTARTLQEELRRALLLPSDTSAAASVSETIAAPVQRPTP